jgi:hypothetical protein
MHFLPDALKLYHHRLDPAGPQAELFKQRGDLSPVAMHLLEIFFDLLDIVNIFILVECIRITVKQL